MSARQVLSLVALLAGCAPPAPGDSHLDVKLVRGDADPLRDPGTATRSVSPVGALRVDLRVNGVTESATTALGATPALDVRVLPRALTGEGLLQVLGLRADDGAVYSAARSAPFRLTEQRQGLSLFFGPVDAFTPVGRPLATPLSQPALAALGDTDALIVGGEAPTQGGFTPASPGLLVFKLDQGRVCGLEDGCLSGVSPPARTDGVAVALSDGSVVHGLGRLATGALDDVLYRTRRDGLTERLEFQGDPLPGLEGAQAVVLADDTVVIAGGAALDGPRAQLFHLDLPNGSSTLQPGALRTARAWGSALVVSTGQVLLVGGRGAAGPLASVELCTPGQGCAFADGGAFAQVRTALRGARLKPALVRLADGSVAIVGGGVETPEVFRLDLGAQVGGLLDLRAPPAAFRQLTPAATRAGAGQLLVVGGEPQGQAPTAALFTPDPSQVLDDGHATYEGTWRAAGAGLTLRARAVAQTLGDGNVLLVGGGIDGEPYLPAAQPSPRVELLVPSPTE